MIIHPCARCGQTINAERDLDPVHQRYFELHLQACALEVEVDKITMSRIIASRLVDLTKQIDALVGVMEDSVPARRKEGY